MFSSDRNEILNKDVGCGPASEVFDDRDRHHGGLAAARARACLSHSYYTTSSLTAGEAQYATAD